MTITPEEIAEWRKVCEEATSGEWYHTPKSEYGTDMGEFRGGEDHALIMGFGDDEQYYPREGTPPNEADSIFITTARTAMPRLLDELAAKDALIAKYDALCKTACDDVERLRHENNNLLKELNITHTALQASEES